MNANSLKAFVTKAWTNFKKPRVALLKVKGTIDSKMTYEFGKSLNSVPKKVKALVVVVNSNGGQPGQCHIITTKLNLFSKTNSVPIYTFAEDYAISGGYYVLSIGQEVYADSASLVGGVGTVGRISDFSGLLKKNDIVYEKHTTNEDTFFNKFDPLEKTKKKDKKYLKTVLEDTNKLFVEHVEKFRGSKIEGPEKREQIFEGDMLTGKQAKALGLVDGLGNFEAVLQQKFPEAKIVDYTRKTLWERTLLVLSMFTTSSKANAEIAAELLKAEKS